jgi:hypothetical protein
MELLVLDNSAAMQPKRWDGGWLEETRGSVAALKARCSFNPTLMHDPPSYNP